MGSHNAPRLYIKNWTVDDSLEPKHVANYVLTFRRLMSTIVDLPHR